MEINKNSILNKIDESIINLKNKKETFSKIENNPELILIELFNREIRAPHYDLHMEIFNRNINKDKDNNYHNLQEYIANILINYFNQIDSDVKVYMVSRNSYPTKFRISYLDEEIISFDIYKGSFCDFRKIEFKDGLTKNISFYEKSIKEDRDQINKYKEWLENPKLMFRDKPHLKIYDYFTYLKHKGKVYENINERIEKLEDCIKRDLESIDRYTNQYQKYVTNKDSVEEKFQEWRSKFSNWNFIQKERRDYGLY